MNTWKDNRLEVNAMPDEARFKPQKEINRLKSQARRLEKDRDKLFPELGRAAYKVFLGNGLDEPSLAPLCGQIKALDGQIEQSRAEMGSLQAQVQQMKAAPVVPAPVGAAAPWTGAGPGCPYCGAPVSALTRFCGNCGRELPAAAPPPSMLCPSCGRPIEPGVKFCGECGAPAEASAPASSEPAPAPAPSASPAAPAPVIPPPPPAPLAPPAGTVTTPAAAPAPPPPAPADAIGRAAADQPTAGGKALTCSKCGAVSDEGDAVFCGECGARLAPDPGV